MTLTTRVSRFFLLALGGTLVCYSLLLLGLIRYYLYREFDQHLESALNTIVAAIEVENDDVKWEPADHQVTFSNEDASEDVHWVVVNERAKIVDQSRNPSHTKIDSYILEYARMPGATTTDVAIAHDDWRILQVRLAAPNPKPVQERSFHEHGELVVTVARSTATLRTTLNLVSGLVLALSLGVWAIAVVGGRWFCRKALEPVGEMASSARMMGPANPLRRLPISPSCDELSDLGLAFNNLLDQLFQAYERQQRFAGDAAHQLRTPLTVLQGQIEVALRRPRSNDEYAKTLNVLNEQVIEVRQMIESLLFLARADDDGEPPNLTLVDLSAWVLNYLLKWKNHSRVNDLRPMFGPSIFAAISPPLLTQLLDNLVNNALKYSENGSPVTVHLKQQASEIALTVADHGIGITPQDRQAIFEPFFRSQNARRSGIAGTGLGLALARRIATTLNGHLECTSVLNEGSQFTLYLPVPSAGLPSQVEKSSVDSTSTVQAGW